MKAKFISVFFLFFFLQSVNIFSQQHEIDSLKNILQIEKEDTNKINTLNELSWSLKNKGDFPPALNYAQQASELSEKISFPKGKATALDRMGLVYYNEGNFAMALEKHFASLKIREEINDKKGIAASHHNIGNNYYAQHEYDKALEQYLLSLKIKEELGSKLGIANSLSNLGSVYVAKRNFQKALENYSKALALTEEAGDKQGIANLLNNIGIIYQEENKNEEARSYHYRSLAIRKELGDREGIATSYLNLGTVHTSLGAEAQSAARKNLFALAQRYLDSALSLSQKVDSKEITMEDYKDLAALDSAMGLGSMAYEHYKKYISYRDSISNEESTKKSLRAQMNYEFDKKESQQKAEQVKQEAENKKQKIIIWFSVIGLMGLAVFAFVIFRSLKTVRMQKLLIEEKTKTVEEKNKDILDSINYAQRIQQAILIPEEEIKKHFSDAFVLFKPKDIVSGDFYWFAESGHNKILAAADCTGHGVPGGFMSMLGFEMLNETLLLEEVKTTAEAFTVLDKKITDILNRNNRSHRDGMDMILCAFSKASNKLQFSCANRPLILIKNGEVKEFAPDKFHIGGGIDETEKKFRNQEIEVQSGDAIYLFSDGYSDQFGGPKEKKFMYKKLVELLVSISKKEMSAQKETLDQTFSNWKGNVEQIDDVMVIGIRI